MSTAQPTYAPTGAGFWTRMFASKRPTNSYFEQARASRNIRVSVGLVMIGLLLSGITAFPLQTEVTWLSRWCTSLGNPACDWLWQVRTALQDTNASYPFMAYGTDWLAFAHIMLAILFIGPLLNPIRNKWVLQFGLIACAAVIPLALIAGHVRDIPMFWQLIDCSFGVFGAIPLGIALLSVQRLERLQDEEAYYLQTVTPKHDDGAL